MKYNIDIERYIGNKFPIIKEIKSIIKNTEDKNKIKDFKILLFFLYISYTLFFIPIIVFCIIVMSQD